MRSGNDELTPQQAAEITELLASLENRPYDFACTMFPWGVPGTQLEHFSGPDKWQSRVWRDMQEKLLSGDTAGAAGIFRFAIKSGNNVGKTMFIAVTCWWLLSTRVNSVGRATANTEAQLKSVLWRELAKWHSLFLARDFFKVTATRISSTQPKYERTWFLVATPWSAENPDAFSGFHNQGNRLFTIFDEASGIDDSIWDRADGACREANTQVFWICTSNPTKNSGRYYKCFNEDAQFWTTYTVSQRESMLVDQSEVEAVITQKGEEDDYVRVFVLGEFPASSFSQLIPIEAIDFAQRRQPTATFAQPLVLGIDIARFGDNENVAVFRRGKDAREIPAERWRGLTVPETGNRIASLINTHRPDAVFIDEGGVGGGVVDYVRLLGHPVFGINFGSAPTTKPEGVLVANKRAEIYLLTRDWLRSGGCIEASSDLKNQLISIEYTFNKKQEHQIMSKEDMRRLKRPSPDWADALALTFALPVSIRKYAGPTAIRRDYDPLGDSALDEFRPRQQQQPHPRSYH